MGFRINTNVAALTAHNNATMNNRNLDSSLNKLSSGLRINTAGDDASGLTIANSLRSQASSLAQAVSNGNDAVGLIKTADGALSEYGDILSTIKTEAVKAASDTQSTASRLAIQKNIDGLMDQLNTIATTTSFNGQKLLSGTFANKEFQLGANANESVKLSIGSVETSQVGQTSRGDLTVDKLGENQLTLRSATTGESITLAPVDLQFNNKAANGMGGLAAQINKYSGETGITANAVVKSDTGKIAGGTTSADFAINGVNIGSVIVGAEDKSGTLQNAINAKTTQTGVTATRTSDGQLSLTSGDGRAIEVKNLSGIVANTDAQMSTMGKLDIVQAGSSDFSIEGANFEFTAAGGDIATLSGTATVIEDSVLKKDSVLGTGTVLVNGTELGTTITATTGMGFVVGSSSADMTLGKDSIILASSVINKDTKLSTDTLVNGFGTLTLSSDMILKAGTILASGTKFDSGTELQQDIMVAGVTYKAGTTLATDLTILTGTVTLAKDMTMFVDVNGSAGAALGSGSKLAVGTVLGLDVTTSGNTTLKADMVLKEGSVLQSGSTMGKGSVLGETVTITAEAVTLSGTMTVKEGSVLASGTTLKEGSTIGADIKLAVDLASTKKDMTLAEGSTILSGSILKKGTVLTQDLTAAQVDGGNGLGLKAGAILDADLTTTADITLTKDLELLKESTLKAGSKIAANSNASNTVSIANKEFTSLDDIDVTTLEGAMKAIDTVAAAISNLDAIRTNVGAAQIQVNSTINNISVTQVNVKAAESNIREVDFAAESANFAKFNILAQSGSYAMSQANAVQQNVMRLLQ